MSATDPAGPTPPHTTAPHSAAIIDLRKARSGTAARKGRRLHSMAPPPPPDRDRTPLERIADYAEERFNVIRRTLTDEPTAEVFLRSLDIFDHTLAGACAQGIITEAQLGDLKDLTDALRQAPGLV